MTSDVTGQVKVKTFDNRYLLNRIGAQNNDVKCKRSQLIGLDRVSDTPETFRNFQKFENLDGSLVALIGNYTSSQMKQLIVALTLHPWR